MRRCGDGAMARVDARAPVTSDFQLEALKDAAAREDVDLVQSVQSCEDHIIELQL